MQDHTINKKKISSYVAYAVQEIIADMGLKPGDHLPSQSQLARQLNVSIPTLREGLERLELVGVVQTVHGKGTIVSEPTSDNLLQTLAPLIDASGQRQQELLELFVILQTSVVQDLLQKDFVDKDISDYLSDISSAMAENRLSQSLIKFFKRLGYRSCNQTVQGLVNLIHELVLFHAKEKGILWLHAAQIKFIASNILDSLQNHDESNVVQYIKRYADLLSWGPREGQKNVSLATGSVGGSFDRFGTRLCSLFVERPDIKIDLVSTGGGIENIDLTDLNRVEFSITQSDIALSAFRGTGVFNQTRTGLRAICRLASLNLWAVVRADSNIKQLYDLKSSRISVGAVGGDTVIITESLFDALGFSLDNYKTFQLSLINAINALKNHEIDAFFYLSQNPFSALDEFHRVSPVRILPIPTDIAQSVLTGHPSWEMSNSLFRLKEDNNPALIPTIGIPTLLITHEKVNNDIVEVFAETIEKNSMFLYANEVDQTKMHNYLFDDIPIPLHDGVRMYLKGNK